MGTMREDDEGEYPLSVRDRLAAIVAAAVQVAGGDTALVREMIEARVAEDPELNVAWTQSVQAQTDKAIGREVNSWLIQNGYRPTAEDWNKWEKPPPGA